jgi:uncharacterized repeat protein (TIGR03803 family)
MAMKLNFSIKMFVGTISLLALLTFATPSAKAQALSVLHSFTASEGQPHSAGDLLKDASGNLYGASFNNNTGTITAFELVKSSGTYSEKVLYTFTNASDTDIYPTLVVDASGNLYGISNGAINNQPGYVFELVNSSGTYSEKVLYNFVLNSSAGYNPNPSLVKDTSGNLYGTAGGGGANGHGVVFELVNSSGSYSEKVLYSFGSSSSDGQHPTGTLIMDNSGNLYGRTDGGGPSGNGVVFELVNSSGTYSEKILYGFTYPDHLSLSIVDASGNLYGTNFNNNPFGGSASVIELVNSSGTYSENVLFSSSGNGAFGGLVTDSSGNLYFTGENIFELVNSSGTYSEKVLHSFQGGTGCTLDGFDPTTALLVDASGNLYGTTLYGGANNYGIVFELVAFSGTAYPTTTTVTSSANPVTAGDTVYFTATVTSSTGYLPSGTISLLSGSTTLVTQGIFCGNTLMGVSQADSIGIGTIPVTAQYTPDVPIFAPSSNTINETVNQAGVALTNSSNTFTGNQTINGTVSVTGNVGVTGNLATTGTLTIGNGGTAITKHLSMTFNPTFSAPQGNACSSVAFAFTGASDGDSIALGVPNSRMIGSAVYTAWVSAANTITIRACAFAPNPPTSFGSGAIRVDLWKH